MINDAAPAKKTAATDAAAGQANWNLKAISGTREEVAEQIQQATFVPDAWKTALTETIKARTDWQAVKVHAHCQAIGDHLNLNVTISKLY